jgi:heme-degrading monooxygenase HmoA
MTPRTREKYDAVRLAVAHVLSTLKLDPYVAERLLADMTNDQLADVVEAAEVQKWCSVAASVATATLNARRPGRLAMFDARVFTISDPNEVANYMIWRQRDAVRNSISMAAQAVFPHKRLHGVNSAQAQELLWAEKGINWNDYPDGCKRGRVVVRASGEREVTFTHKRTQVEETVVAMRSWWETRAAPHFTTNAGGFLAGTIPALPVLGTVA